MRSSFPADNRPQQHYSHQMSAGNVYLSVHLRAVESVGRPNPKYWVCIAPGGPGFELTDTPFSRKFVYSVLANKDLSMAIDVAMAAWLGHRNWRGT